MNIKINCNNKQEVDDVLELLSSKYQLSDVNILKSNEFTFLADNYFIELNTDNSDIINKDFNDTFDISVGSYYIYKNNLVQVTKFDNNELDCPYKCNVFNELGKVNNSKWVNSIELIPLEAITKRTLPNKITSKTIKNVKRDLEVFKKSFKTNF